MATRTKSRKNQATQHSTESKTDAPTENGTLPDPAQSQRNRSVYVPASDEVKSELWRIATGDGTESSRVAALRILADVLGMMKPETSEIPEAMSALLDALAAGMSPGAPDRSLAGE